MRRLHGGNPLIRNLAILYVAGLHVAIAILLINTDAVFRVRLYLGLAQPYEIDQRSHAAVAAHLDRVDRVLKTSPVVLLGDSIVHGIPGRYMQERWVNLGLGGQTLAGLARSLVSYPSLGLSSIIVVQSGINDLCGGIDERGFVERVDIVASRLPGGVPLIWSAILPIEERVARGSNRCLASTSQIARANELIRLKCLTLPTCSYFDGYALLSGPSGIQTELHTGDGLHLNDAGYRVLIPALAGKIREGIRLQGVKGASAS